eukprot:CAMPEP_0204521326 /NCGR_PEP_ID=MMETSP0661-20131031/5723_1 /ASSEMBLY_ACC=CAM_ASM_000606 /TAXON_ID=109239 /ORGANISM="Alexandrium margalefi, Strain AMGDE01CS-322" /LENGTH=200 /DNA_ID=CAMNT_0051526911 /DNA_START=65 /DNA_END=663 /DNA_ORIENTATION=+
MHCPKGSPTAAETELPALRCLCQDREEKLQGVEDGPQPPLLAADEGRERPRPTARGVHGLPELRDVARDDKEVARVVEVGREDLRVLVRPLGHEAAYQDGHQREILRLVQAAAHERQQHLDGALPHVLLHRQLREGPGAPEALQDDQVEGHLPVPRAAALRQSATVDVAVPHGRQHEDPPDLVQAGGGRAAQALGQAQVR